MVRNRAWGFEGDGDGERRNEKKSLGKEIGRVIVVSDGENIVDYRMIIDIRADRPYIPYEFG